MWNSLKKIFQSNPEGRPCKDCGHYETSHYLNMVTPKRSNKELWAPDMKRMNCRKCPCEKFR